MANNLILFYVFAAIAVVATLLVIAQSNPIYSVLLLIASFMALAGLYVLLDAPFVAVTQIIVYAGAIMVLFLFVVMLLNVPREDALDASGGIEESTGARALGHRAGGGHGRRAGLGAEPDADPGRRFRSGRREAVVVRRGDRPDSVPQLRVRLRGDVDPDSDRDGRRHRAGRPSPQREETDPESRTPNPDEIMAELNHYLVLSGVLFAIGMMGVFLRRNVITMLLSIEVMLNAVNLTFIAFGHFLGSPDGQIIVFFVITVAAAEAAVGLAIVIALFRHTESLNPDAFRELKG